MAGARVLVVDDDPTVADVVARYLVREGFEVSTATDGRTALESAISDPPSLVVLDLMLPVIDGVEVCRRLRSTLASQVPVIMLTARDCEKDRIAGLDTGADDYVTKPFSPSELVARVKAVLRRTGPASEGLPSHLEAGPLLVDTLAHEVHLRGRPVALTTKEFQLLVHLMRNPRRAYTREELLEQVWGYTVGDTATVTVHVRRLREKIEDDAARPQLVATVWGVGYRFEPPSDGMSQSEEGR